MRTKGDGNRCSRFSAVPKPVLLCIGILLLSSGGVQPAVDSLTPTVIARIKSDLPPLDFSANRSFSPELAAVFRYYGLDSGNVPHRFGTFASGPHRLAAHIFLPPTAEASVFLLHGFFDHSGILRHLIHRCIEAGFAVAVFDLPGHGLSSGDPGAISDFVEYARIVRDFVRICKPYLPADYHLVGHSTGAAVAIEVLLNSPPQMPDFDRVVLAAPLIHHRFHRLARAQLFLIKPFADDLPRRHHRNSSDRAFVEWSEQDPLQGRRISFTWLEALYAWNDRLSGYGQYAEPVMILQGTKDSVVDWRYNVAVLQQVFTTARLVWIEGGRHQLFNEGLQIRAEVLDAVMTFLLQPVPPGQQ